MTTSFISPPSIEIREGTTDQIIMQLLADGDPIDLSGVDHVTLEMRDSKKRTYKYSSDDPSPKFEITDAGSGIVALTPPNATLFKTVLSPFVGYVWVYTTGTKKYSVPEETDFLIKVRRNY